ncbi:MAG: sulfurtransferase [Candidatus Eremiobacteraeota bacterium]|nr:sulfurtransferase [Candidatus Eremiobacteraeota bacterium]
MDAPEISVDELAQWFESDKPFTLLDVREDDEFAFASIDGSMHVPMRQVRKRLGEIPKGKPIVVICHVGERSAYVARALIATGLPDVYNLAGGIDAYSAFIDPAIPRY